MSSKEENLKGNNFCAGMSGYFGLSVIKSLSFQNLQLKAYCFPGHISKLLDLELYIVEIIALI